MKTLEITGFSQPEYVGTEAFNTLCTNLSYCGNDIRKVMITSRYATEGKSYVSMNLMRSLAKLGRRVVLVDADLRASAIQEEYKLRFNAPSRAGLSEYLAGRCAIEEALYQTDIAGACMIPAGREAPNPLQLLDTEHMGQLLDWLAGQFDVVLVDTPPVGLLVDGIALGKFCDGALLVVSYRKGKRKEIRQAVQNIDKTGCKTLGAVLNNVEFKRFSNKLYYYNSAQYTHYYPKK